MGEGTGRWASELRQELGWRNRQYAVGRSHVESYGGQPVIVYAPEDTRHGNFYDAAYAEICARPEWLKRLGKVHAQAARSLPKAERRWRELDSSMSSDALLMNIFCAPGVVDRPQVQRLLGFEAGEEPVFGWRARVPFGNGLLDRTEVDMCLGSLLVEAKLTENDFQTRSAAAVEAYRDFEAVFDPQLLPRVRVAVARQRTAAEHPEEYTQEAEGFLDPSGFEREILPVDGQPLGTLMLEARLRETRPAEGGYASYQLIRNVLAAYAEGRSFCVLHDARRPDLREAWFQVMRAVRSAELRVRLKVLTWQELAALLPVESQDFLERKYGIVG